MRMYDIIGKKKISQELTSEELRYFVNGVTDGSIPDYQTSALLMAIYFNGMTAAETAEFTMLMAKSGDTVDLSGIKGFKADKHSTGGVGDKTTLIVAPIVAACGVSVAKMSGRGLGHTGGTVDKLEAIEGFCTSLTTERFFQVVNETGLAVVGQTGNLAPADKKLYAIRDVTATVDSIPLMAASIMSKKLAAGADGIVLDVKTGSGAFMKTIEDSTALARVMVDIGERTGHRTVALITNMSRPLGLAIGNALEVEEAVNTLRGKGPQDLTEVCLELSANMLFLALGVTIEECRALAKEALDSGKAFEKFKAMVGAQGGNTACIEDTSLLCHASVVHEVKSQRDGYVTLMDAERIGVASVVLGAGRETKESSIDYAAGIILPIKPGAKVQKGEVIAVLHTNNPTAIAQAEQMLLGAITIEDAPPVAIPLILGRVHKDGTELY